MGLDCEYCGAPVAEGDKCLACQDRREQEGTAPFFLVILAILVPLIVAVPVVFAIFYL